MGQQPRQKGFLNNFGAVSQAMIPAIATHDQAEEEGLAQNNAMANQILNYQAAQEAKQEQAAEREWRKQHAEAQLGEQRRYHDMMNSRQMGGNAPQLQNDMAHLQDNTSQPNLASEFSPIESKAEITAYAKDKKALGSTLQELHELERDYYKFREDYQNNLIDPMSPYANVANPTKDFFGKFANNSSLRKEAADRHTLNSRLNKFVVSSERALKGGGVMGPKLIELFKAQGIYPDLGKDTPEIFESKLNMLKDEIENSYKASDLSLRYGIRLDPSNASDFENRLRGETPAGDSETSPAEPELVTMQDANGSQYMIPATEVDEALGDGLTVLR